MSENFESSISNTEVSIHESDDIIANSHRLEIVDSLGRRQHVRFSGQITVVLSNDRSIFRTTTVNISSGGALLRDLVPHEFLSRPFDCLFIAERADSTKEYLLVRGKSLEFPLRSQRVQFVTAPTHIQEALHSIFG